MAAEASTVFLKTAVAFGSNSDSIDGLGRTTESDNFVFVECRLRENTFYANF